MFIVTNSLLHDVKNQSNTKKLKFGIRSFLSFVKNLIIISSVILKCNDLNHTDKLVRPGFLKGGH